MGFAGAHAAAHKYSNLFALFGFVFTFSDRRECDNITDDDVLPLQSHHVPVNSLSNEEEQFVRNSRMQEDVMPLSSSASTGLQSFWR